MSTVKRSSVNELDNGKELEGESAAFSKVINLWKQIVFEKSTLWSLMDGVCGIVGKGGLEKSGKFNSRDGWNFVFSLFLF